MPEKLGPKPNRSMAESMGWLAPKGNPAWDAVAASVGDGLTGLHSAESFYNTMAVHSAW